MARSEIYVSVGPIAAKKTFDRKFEKTLPKIMQSTVEKVLAKASGLTTKKPRDKNAEGFYIGGALLSLTKDLKGAKAIIGCKVDIYVATHPKKSLFAMLKGGAKVQTGTSEKEIGLAAEDCVTAVIESLIKGKAVRAIRKRAAK